MPLPWKKAKASRISKLFADRLTSSKHGGSLVVETGFPTSLVDLFVKNRDRLKKSSSKKKRSNLIDKNPPFTSPSPPLDYSSSNVIVENLDDRESFRTLVCDEIVAGDDVPSFNSSGIVSCGSDGAIVEKNVDVVVNGKRGVFVAVLKGFFVVVLALGTKKLAVGITLSALLLFSLEYVWMHLCRFLKPCFETKLMLKSLFQRVVCVFRIKQDKLDGREMSIASDCSGLIKVHDLNSGIVWPKSSRVEEIQVVQPKASIEEEIKSLNERFDTSDCNKKWVYEQMDSKVVMVKQDEYRCNNWGCAKMDSKKGGMEKIEDCRSEVSEFENRKSRRAKFKSKMKKLVPKKLYCSKKKGLDLKSEVYGLEGEEDKAEEQVEDKDEAQNELECEEKLLSFSRGNYDGQEDGDAIHCFAGISQGDVKTAVVSEEMGTKTLGNSAYLVLFLIVLAGLFGGRILALVLTLSWCLMLKSSETLRRFVRVPMVRNFVKMPS